MGRELTTTIQCGTAKATAKVLLESAEIIVRGELKRRFPFGSMKNLAVHAGRLTFTCDDEKVAIQLDDAADAWMKRINNPPSRVDKLRVKPGMKVHLAGAVEADVAGELESAGATIMRKLAAGVDVVMLFIRKPTELKQLAPMERKLAAGGAIWVMWPKGAGGPVTHEAVAAAGRAAGMSQTISMGFSPTFTGLRFVRPVKK